MPKEKIAFQTNIPVEVQLAYADGKKVTGQYGDSFMYTLRGDRVMFVPSFVRERIQELQPQAGQWFSICKREVQASEGKTRIDWEVLLCGSRGSPTSGSAKGGNGQGNNGHVPAAQPTGAGQYQANQPPQPPVPPCYDSGSGCRPIVEQREGAPEWGITQRRNTKAQWQRL